ncbi:hypothetical protein SynSYN20_00921 [Synechococcus sp. SYN20]|nr:hypothetical protein SynSYN20_00921 [Synechococcus sp. SYN20]
MSAHQFVVNSSRVAVISKGPLEPVDSIDSIGFCWCWMKF